MNSNHLSARLGRVADLIHQHVPQPIRLADIGSDHAYLPCHLVLSERIEFAVAGEVVEGPYQSAVAEVAAQSLNDRIQVRKANGLAAIEWDDRINAISICGMGGSLICTILDEGKAPLAHRSYLILQANIGEHLVREWLMTHCYQIIDEALVEDNGRLYEIIVAKPSDELIAMTPTELLAGPFLSRRQGALFSQKWQREYANYQRIAAQLEQATTLNQKKLVEVLSRMALIQALLNKEN